MTPKAIFFVLSTFALLLTINAGTWDTFEIGNTYADDISKCISKKYNMEMMINTEYQVPDKCATVMCHDSYVISERTLELDKEYKVISACGKMSCDDKGKLTVEKCPEIKYDDKCTHTSEDLTRAYPECCPKKVCSESRVLVSKNESSEAE